MRKYDLVIFDLDGTLADTSIGIYNSVRYAEKSLKLTPIVDDKLHMFVGPPPAKMYEKMYGLTKEEAYSAAIRHREYGSKKGYKESKLYDGIEKLLYDLKREGFMLAVATLKKEETAIELLKFHGIFSMFNAVIGMDNQELKTKSSILDEVIKKCSSNSPILIGDTDNDFLGAKECGIDFIGVTYGFGFSEADNQINYAKSPNDILSIL